MFQEQDKNKNLLIVAAVLIVLVLGGILWFFLAASPTPAPLPVMVDVSVNGKVYGFAGEDIRLSVPEMVAGDKGAFMESRERRIDIKSVSSVVMLDVKAKSRSLASVSDIRYDSELTVYGKTSDLKNGTIVADKIEIIK